MSGSKPVTFFGEMSLDIAKKLPDLWNDVCEISRKNGYIVDAEFNVISLYEEMDSKLYVTKIITGGDRRVKKIIRRVFEKTKAEPVEQYEMIGTDGKLPIWKNMK
ncbi:MAG: hypothetical protein ACREBA_00520 [Nitrosotalea sp.]